MFQTRRWLEATAHAVGNAGLRLRSRSPWRRLRRAVAAIAPRLREHLPYSPPPKRDVPKTSTSPLQHVGDPVPVHVHPCDCHHGGGRPLRHWRGRILRRRGAVRRGSGHSLLLEHIRDAVPVHVHAGDGHGRRWGCVHRRSWCSVLHRRCRRRVDRRGRRRVLHSRRGCHHRHRGRGGRVHRGRWRHRLNCFRRHVHRGGRGHRLHRGRRSCVHRGGWGHRLHCRRRGCVHRGRRGHRLHCGRRSHVRLRWGRSYRLHCRRRGHVHR